MLLHDQERNQSAPAAEPGKAAPPLFPVAVLLPTPEGTVVPPENQNLVMYLLELSS